MRVCPLLSVPNNIALSIFLFFKKFSIAFILHRPLKHTFLFTVCLLLIARSHPVYSLAPTSACIGNTYAALSLQFKVSGFNSELSDMQIFTYINSRKTNMTLSFSKSRIHCFGYQGQNEYKNMGRSVTWMCCSACVEC